MRRLDANGAIRFAIAPHTPALAAPAFR